MADSADSIRELVANLIRLRSDLSGIRELANTIALQVTTLSVRSAEQKVREQSAQQDLRNAVAQRQLLDEQNRACQSKQAALERRIQAALEEQEHIFAHLAAADCGLAAGFLDALRNVDAPIGTPISKVAEGAADDGDGALKQRIAVLETRLSVLEGGAQPAQGHKPQPAVNRVTETQAISFDRTPDFIDTVQDAPEPLPGSPDTLRASMDTPPVLTGMPSENAASEPSSAKTSGRAKKLFEPMAAGAGQTDAVPAESAWRRWKLEFEGMQTRYSDLPTLHGLWQAYAEEAKPGERFQALHNALAELEHWNDLEGGRDSAVKGHVKALYERLNGELKSILRSSTIYTAYQRLLSGLDSLEKESGLSDLTLAAMRNARDVLGQWAIFMDKEGLWWDAAAYDQRVARATTDLFDQLAGEPLESRWKTLLSDLESFLRPSGVRRDMRLKTGVKHGELPPALQNHFQENSRGSGLHMHTAQCRIGRILHQRWVLSGPDGQDLEITKPLYQFAL